jgi:hypothetical protein
VARALRVMMQEAFIGGSDRTSLEEGAGGVMGFTGATVEGVHQRKKPADYGAAGGPWPRSADP